MVKCTSATPSVYLGMKIDQIINVQKPQTNHPNNSPFNRQVRVSSRTTDSYKFIHMTQYEQLNIL